MKYLVQINYKSGNSMQLWCKEFIVHRGQSGIDELKLVVSEEKKRILYLGINDIESIFQVDAINIEG